MRPTITVFVLFSVSKGSCIVSGSIPTKREKASLNSETCSSVRESACQHVKRPSSPTMRGCR